MSRAKKIAVLAIIAMVLTMLPVQMFGAVNVSADRLYGDNRVETALAVCQAGWATSATTVILAPANQENLVDALAASSLAGQENAPILLTDKNSLDPLVKAEIVSLGTDIVYVVGAIADSVAAEVEAMNEVDAIVLKGADRWATTAAINAQLKKPAGCFVVGYNALPDALSASSYAAKNGFAIILADTAGKIPAGQKELGSKTYILGGPTLVEHIAGSTRIYGSDRYATNAEFAKFFMNTHGGMKAMNPYQKVFVANGATNHLVDSLVVAPYAAVEDAFIFLTNGTSAPPAAAHIPEGVDLVPVALGGTGVVSEAARIAATNNDNQAAVTFEVTGVTAESLQDVKITFSQAVDEDSAELASSYVLAGADLINASAGADPHDVAVMQADGKSVVVTLATAVPQSKSRIFEVKGGFVSMDSKDKSTAPHYTKDLTFTDTTAPTVTDVKVIGTKKLKVTFSESVKISNVAVVAAGVYDLDENDFADWKIDGDRLSNRNLDTVTCLETEAARNGANLYARSLTFTFNDPIPNGAHQLEIPAASAAGAILSDGAGFLHQKEVKDFTIASYTTAPVVQDVFYDKGDVYVQFDRPVAPNTDKDSFSINTTNGTSPTSGVSSIELKSDDTKVKIIPSTANAKILSGSNFVEISKDLKDAWGNKLHGTYNQRYNFTVELDKTKPTVEQITCLGTNKLRIHFSEKVKKDFALNENNYKITKADGSAVPITQGIDSVPQSVAGADIDSDTYDIKFNVGTLVDSNYTITVKGIVDMFDNTMNDYTTTFNGIDDIGPSIYNAANRADNTTSPDAVRSSVDASWAVLFFDTALDVTSATTVANYQYVDGNGQYRPLPADSKVLLDATGKIVTVDFPAGYTLYALPVDAENTPNAMPKTKYSVQAVVVSSVKDKAGNVMQGIAQTCDIVDDTHVTMADLLPTLVSDSFILYDDGDYVKAQFVLSHEVKNFDYTDFLVGKTADKGVGDVADSGSRSGQKITLTFSNSAKIARVRALGKDAHLNLVDNTAGNVIQTANDAGLVIDHNQTQLVYDDQVKPKWVSMVAYENGNNADAANKQAGESIILTFSEAIDDTIRGNYLNDFTFQVGSLYAVPDAVIAADTTTNQLIFYDFKTSTGAAINPGNFHNGVTGALITVKANDSVDIRDLKDAYGDYNVYAPSNTNKTTGMSGNARP